MRLCSKKKKRGIAIKPANEIDLPISITSLNIGLLGLRKNWNNTSDISDIKITITIFKIKSLNVLL